MKKQDIERIKSLLDLGSSATSSVAGTLIGFLLGSLPGAIAGAIIAPGAKKVLYDIAVRVLSPREKLRVADTARYAIEKIISNLQSDIKPRDDRFFDDIGEGRSHAEEIFEGVLLKAKSEHEEKKTKILGTIYANIAFSEGFSIGEANHLLQIVESLTYRQLCILALVEKKTYGSIKLSEKDYQEFRANDEAVSYETISILQEIFQIYNFGIVTGKRDFSETIEDFLSWADIIPNHVVLSELGKRYCKIMGLQDIPDKEIEEVAGYLN
ncbi:MAG: hypothetical protein WBB67_06475 [bacterium]